VVAPPPLALRLFGQDHALEPGRDYLLGSDRACDLVLPAGAGAGARHAVLRVGEAGVELEDLGSGAGTCHNGTQVERTPLQPGDRLRLGQVELLLTVDAGNAVLVPLPALRAAATFRRQLHVRRAAVASMRRRESQSFRDLMAEELRRAPWLGGSLLLHVLLLLVMWLLAPAGEGNGEAPAKVAIDFVATAPPGHSLPALPEVAAEPPAVDFAAALPVEPETPDERPMPDPRAGEVREPMRHNPRLAPRARAGGSRNDADVADLGTVGSGGFRRTVAELRESGLEIVFVFDSTGSMSRTILDTKNTIAQMLTVLRALVPDARVGIVTYRDQGKREEYLVREIPLGVDFWRASNFMQSVTAGGGGDQPEDVRAGMRAAFRQRWHPGTRRVIVLAGDAPPHDGDVKSLLAEVRSFTRNGRAFVHTLVTSPEHAGQHTRRAFAAIAAAGGGTCTDLQAHEKVLQRVLALAFGQDFEQDVAAVVQTVTAAAAQVDVASLDLAHRGGTALQRELRRDPVPATLLNALVRRPRRAVVHELLDQLGNRSTPEHTRHAIGWVLQRVFTLSVPPVDPESGEPPDETALGRWHQRCDDLPD
jgi:Mg-chelatase subunit ChlD